MSIKENSVPEVGDKKTPYKLTVEKGGANKDEETLPVTETKSKKGKKVEVIITHNEDSSLESYLERKERERGGSLKIMAEKAADKIIETFIKNMKERRQINEQEKLEREQPISKIANILVGRKIDEIIVSSGERKMNDKEKGSYSEREIEEMGGKIPTFKQDLDTRMALEILNSFNNKEELGDIYNENAKSTIINIRQREMEPAEKTKGVRVFVDTGGSWMNFEVDGETTTIRFDHHGTGAREATSGTKMIYEALKKAELLNDSPELEKLVNFVNEYDNLTYLNEVDENGKKIFNEEYFRDVWPNSMYAIAEKMPFYSFAGLVMSGKIKNPSVPFTKEEIDGEIGDIVVGDKTIRELCTWAKEGNKSMGVKNIEGAVKTIKGVKDSRRYAKQEGLNLDNTTLGKIIYNNYYGEVETAKNDKFKVKIVDSLGFTGTKALGYDTYVSWNEEIGKEKFFINSNSQNLKSVADRINKKYPGCAVEARGTFIHGKIKGITEREFLDFIDFNILRGSKFKIDQKKIQVNKKNTSPDKATIDSAEGNEESKTADKKNNTHEESKTNLEKAKQEQINQMVEKLIISMVERQKREKRIEELTLYIQSLDGESQSEKDQIGKKETKTHEAKDFNEKKMYEYKAEYAKVEGKKEDIRNKIKGLDLELENISKLNFVKKIKLNNKIDNYYKEIDYLRMEEMIIRENFNKIDREKFPFAYYIADKIKNPSVRQSFTRKALRVKKDVDREYISLDCVNSAEDNREIVDPMNFLRDFDLTPEYLGRNNHVKYNVYGLCIKSLNRNVITNERDQIIDLENMAAKFKVINQDGKVLIDGADYNNAYQIYAEATNKYKKQVEEEFKNLTVKN